MAKINLPADQPRDTELANGRDNCPHNKRQGDRRQVQLFYYRIFAEILAITPSAPTAVDGHWLRGEIEIEKLTVYTYPVGL